MSIVLFIIQSNMPFEHEGVLPEVLILGLTPFAELSNVTSGYKS